MDFINKNDRRQSVGRAAYPRARAKAQEVTLVLAPIDHSCHLYADKERLAYLSWD